MRLPRAVVFGIAGYAAAHGDHGDHGSGSQKPMVDENASWMEKHMAGMYTSLSLTMSPANQTIQ
jgi:hypothetical protein